MSENAIAGFVGGMLDESEVLRVDSHLASCQACLWLVTGAAVGAQDEIVSGAGSAKEATEPQPNRFELRHLIAQGGMGAVYHGYDHQNGTAVAIKQLRGGPTVEQPALLGRFLREAEILRRLDHPNIVKMIASVSDGDRHQIVMEYVSGGSLRDVLKTHPQLSLSRVMTIMLELTDALSRAHHLKVIHRDIKPENVLLATDGTPRLSDFGLAMMADNALSTPNAILGTIAYLSPEALSGEALDARTDIWAMGVMLFEMLTGSRPFGGDTAAAVVTAILHQPTPDLEVVCPQAPVALVDLVYRMLEKDRHQRIGSARCVGSEIEALLAARGDSTHISDTTRARLVRRRESGVLRGPRVQLPAQTTPFVGREVELAALARLLANDDVRAVTILGPGGMGKSRLALEAAREFAAGDVRPRAQSLLGERFSRSVFFVDLAPLASPDLIVTAVAEAVGFQFAPGRPPLLQLLAYFHEKQLLLLMDNFEHVIAGAGFVNELLQAAADVKVLSTSRVPLGLSAETHFTLTGMNVPECRVVGDRSEVSAIDLFVNSARRARHGFDPSEAEFVQIAGICRMVQGMPLGIVLAASWIALLSPAEIAEEIGKTIDFLQNNARDYPKRQASIRAVFDHSWALLTSEEQSALAAISVFRGGFTRQAAETVGHASLRTLASLVAKSLLRRVPETGRYEIHELLRQYAEARLRTVSSEHDAAMDRMAKTYAEFLSERTDQVLGPRRYFAVQEILDEMDNVRVALHCMLEQHDAGRMNPALQALGLFYHCRRSRPEGEAVLGSIVTAFTPIEVGTTPQARRAVGIALIYQALFVEEQGRKREAAALVGRAVTVLSEIERGGDYALALAMFAWICAGIEDQDLIVTRIEEAIALYRARGDGWWLIRALATSFRVYVGVVGDLVKAEVYLRESIALQKILGQGIFFPDTLGALGLLRSSQGHRREGCDLILESLAIAEGSRDAWATLLALQFAARAHRDLGDYPAAEAFVGRCIAYARELGSFETMAWCHLTLGSVLKAQHRFEEAIRHYREGALQSGGDIAITARAELGLGDVALQQGDYREAQRYLGQSLKVCEEKRMTRGILGALEGLGYLACEEQRHDLAEGYFRRAFELARARQKPAALVSVLAGIAWSCAKSGRTLRAAELAGLVTNHPAITHPTRTRWIVPLLEELKATLGEADLLAALERGRSLKLEAALDGSAA